MMSSVTLLEILRAALGRVLCTHDMKRWANVRTGVLTEVANGYGAVMQLLLTWLGVEAHRGPPSFHCCLIFLPPWRSLMNGGPPSRASSASPTTMGRGRRNPMAVAPPGCHVLAETTPEATRPRCIPRLHPDRPGHRPADVYYATFF